MKAPYWEDEDTPYKHARLVFPKEWLGTKLPPAWKHPLFDEPRGSDQAKHFEVELLDKEDGRVYRIPMWPHYETRDGWDASEEMILHTYMYLEHYCACHRKGDAVEHGAAVENDECEGERFVVKSITAPAFLPGVVLWSEMMTAAEMERTKTWEDVPC